MSIAFVVGFPTRVMSRLARIVVNRGNGTHPLLQKLKTRKAMSIWDGCKDKVLFEIPVRTDPGLRTTSAVDMTTTTKKELRSEETVLLTDTAY